MSVLSILTEPTTLTKTNRQYACHSACRTRKSSEMKKVYKSKVDAWLVIIISGLTLIPMASMLYSGFSVVLFCIVIAILVCIMTMLFGIRYIIDGKDLVVQCGFLFSERFHIDYILSITLTHTMLSSPAASLDRLELKFRNGSVVISPKDKISFIKDIQGICSHEINISLYGKNII